MKVVTKFLFVALLIGIALSLPTRIRADDGLMCNWEGYSQCYSSLQQWMSQCTRDCTMNGGGGGSSQYCYQSPYEDCEPNPPGHPVGPCFTSYYTDCMSIPNSGGSCISGCISQYNSQFSSCLSTWCY